MMASFVDVFEHNGNFEEVVETYIEEAMEWNQKQAVQEPDYDWEDSDWQSESRVMNKAKRLLTPERLSII